MWAGIRATHGVLRGKVFYEVHVINHYKVGNIAILITDFLSFLTENNGLQRLQPLITAQISMLTIHTGRSFLTKNLIYPNEKKQICHCPDPEYWLTALALSWDDILNVR